MTTPVAIRRAPSDFHMPKSHHHHNIHQHNYHQAINVNAKINNVKNQTGGGNQIFGTTPGGTNRIVYSREQLLLLASSPLSQTITPVPQEISRSPELKSDGFAHQNSPYAKSPPQQPQQQQRNSPRTTNASSTVRNPSPPWTTVVKSGNGRKNDIKPLNMNNIQYGRSPGGRSPSANFNVGSIGSAGISSNNNNNVARSPPNSASKPRSPGNAFNFGGKAGQQTNTTPTSFKERLEAAEAAVAKQQANNKEEGEEEEGPSLSSENNLKRGRLGSNSSTSTTSNGNNHHENDEQFAMEM